MIANIFFGHALGLLKYKGKIKYPSQENLGYLWKTLYNIQGLQATIKMKIKFVYPPSQRK